MTTKDLPKNTSEGSMEEVESNVEALMEKYKHLTGGEKTPPPMAELPTAAEEEALDTLKANAIREKISSQNFTEGLQKELTDLENLAEYNRKKDEEKEQIALKSASANQAIVESLGSGYQREVKAAEDAGTVPPPKFRKPSTDSVAAQ